MDVNHILVISCGLTEYQPKVYSPLITAAQKEKVYKDFEDDAEFYAYATPSRLPVKFVAFISKISCITLIVF